MPQISSLVRRVRHYRHDRDRHIDFMIIGIAKCGTSWLSGRLNELPDVQRSKPKETHFFKFRWRDIYDEWSDRKVRARYLHRFWTHPRKPILFEASPGYLSFPASVSRVKRLTPTTRFVVLLRDPAKRAYSAYNMWVRKRGFEPSFEDTYQPLLQHASRCYEECIDDISFYECVGLRRPNSMIAFGLYYYHFKIWLENFPRSQFHIMTTPQLNDREKIAELLQFIGVNPDDMRHMQLEMRPKGRHKGEPMSDAAYDELSEFYRPFNRKLFGLLGVEDLPW